MPYQLVFEEPEAKLKGPSRGAGSVFLSDLPADYKVYLFYYAGINVNNDLVKKLKFFGKSAGQNLYVNIGRLDDPNYRTIASKFQIRKFPTIIITAEQSLASPPSGEETPAIKIDDKTFIAATDSVCSFIEKAFNLFMDLKIKEAMKEKDRDLRSFKIKGFLTETLRGIAGYAKEWTYTLSIFEGKLTVKPKGE